VDSQEPMTPDPASDQTEDVTRIPVTSSPPRSSTPPFPTDRDTVALAAMMGICNRFLTNTVALAFRGQQCEKVKPDLARRHS
jgi:hypothetical protein